jgi:hypothetical protein
MVGRREFEWDDAKARANLAKHGVPFDYAARAFLDPGMIEFDASREGTQKYDARRSGWSKANCS